MIFEMGDESEMLLLNTAQCATWLIIGGTS